MVAVGLMLTLVDVNVFLKAEVVVVVYVVVAYVGSVAVAVYVVVTVVTEGSVVATLVMYHMVQGTARVSSEVVVVEPICARITVVLRYVAVARLAWYGV